MHDQEREELEQKLQTLSKRLEDLSAQPAGAQSAEEFVKLFQEKRALEESLRRAPKPRRRDRFLETWLQRQSAVGNNSGSVLANVHQRLASLEKRDWELWWIVSLTGLIVGGGLLVMLLPAAIFDSPRFHFEITLSRNLVAGLIALMILTNTYLVSRRIELRHLREETISSAIQNELLRMQSFTDPLTEIYNRRSLEELAVRYMTHARRLKAPLTFMLLNVDRFSQINARFGHLTGDFVLAEMATLFHSSIRGSDAVLRFGGDEFLVLLADTTAVKVVSVMDRIQANLNEWNKSGHLEGFSVTLSIGVAEWEHGQTLDEILDRADQDLNANRSHKPHLVARRAAASSAD